MQSNIPKTIINKYGLKTNAQSEIATILNDHFGTVGQRMADKLDNDDPSSCVGEETHLIMFKSHIPLMRRTYLILKKSMLLKLKKLYQAFRLRKLVVMIP